jgi:putative protease
LEGVGLMKIQMPLSSVDEVESLILAGADEFYCGIMPDSWIKKYGFEVPLNCRSTYPNANFFQISELSEAIRITHFYNKEIFLTLNESSYNQQQVDYIINLICELLRINLDGIIVSSLALLNEIVQRKIPIKIAISSEANCTNNSAVEFYKNFGVNRIVFPRHMTIKEINSTTKKHPNMEFEAFVLNESCFFNGGHCYSIHNNNNSQLCMTLKYELRPNSQKYNDKEYLERCRDHTIKHIGRIPNTSYLNARITKCGLCSIKLLGASGVNFLKIVGRTESKDNKIKWVKIVKKAIEISEKESDFNNYSELCKDTFFGESKADFCDRKKFCYYPDEVDIEG